MRSSTKPRPWPTLNRSPSARIETPQARVAQCMKIVRIVTHHIRPKSHRPCPLRHALLKWQSDSGKQDTFFSRPDMRIAEQRLCAINTTNATAHGVEGSRAGRDGKQLSRLRSLSPPTPGITSAIECTRSSHSMSVRVAFPSSGTAYNPSQHHSSLTNPAR